MQYSNVVMYLHWLWSNSYTCASLYITFSGIPELLLQPSSH